MLQAVVSVQNFISSVRMKWGENNINTFRKQYIIGEKIKRYKFCLKMVYKDT